MLSLSDNDELDRVERLVQAPKPIRKWDGAYQRNEVHKKIAFLARREGRSEILPRLSTLFSDRTIQGERLWTFTLKNPSARTERKKGVYRGLELEAKVRLPSCSRPSRPGTGFDRAEHGLLQLRIRFVCDGEYIEQDLAEIMFQYRCPRFAWASAYGVKDWRFPCG
jgi:hypothetical protein